jgi:hypothetical protein
VQGNDQAQSSSQDSIISALVVTLTRNPERRCRAIAQISSHPSVRVAAVKDLWLPLAVEARNEHESHAIHHWITSVDGVDVADVVAISCTCDATRLEQERSK